MQKRGRFDALKPLKTTKGIYKALRLQLLASLLIVAGLLSAQPPEGYYSNAEGLSGEALQQELHIIIRAHTLVTYSSIWDHFPNTDAKQNGKVWDMYSDIPGGNPPYEFEFGTDQCSISGQPEGSCYNREHTFPTSWSGGGTSASDTIYTDLFHVIPTDSWVNSHRSNYPYGIVDGDATTLNGSKKGSNAYQYPGAYTGTVFEPIDPFKGDLARHYFYIMTRYKHKISEWSDNTPMLEGDDLAPWALAMLLEWHTQDPVSQKEINRNNAVYTIQGNRNPFIDHPEYVNDIWNSGPVDEPESHVTGFSANTITLNWTDAAGPVTPEAYLVRMSDTSYESITTPANSTPVSDDFWNKNVNYGKQTVTFGGLTPGHTYYFKIFSYNGSGDSIIYKTDGQAQQVSIQAN